jgi:L-2-hydroxyglutarate oxidase LhgO
MKRIKTDFLIIGGGIIGLATARALKEKFRNAKILLIEKESDVAKHASGRNSGVIHAGFYYTADSLKAKFTRRGNIELAEFCERKGIKINKCGKVVVAKDERELETLHELKRRGNLNEVPLEVIDEKRLQELEPYAKTYKEALWSPTTSTVNPKEVCLALKEELEDKRVEFLFNTPYRERLNDNTVRAGDYEISYGVLINCAGLYADKIAKDFGKSKNYAIIPFKGVYLEYTDKDIEVRRNIYPVPNLKNPFLGVHYTVLVNGKVKLGPTAIPAFWRENYKGFKNFSFSELVQILYWEAVLFLTNASNFRTLALEEVRKYWKPYMQMQALKLSKGVDVRKFNRWGKAGIRAQLLNTKTKELVMDFVVEKGNNDIHILNAVSPAFTASFPFTRWVVEKFV